MDHRIIIRWGFRLNLQMFLIIALLLIQLSQSMESVRMPEYLSRFTPTVLDIAIDEDPILLKKASEVVETEYQEDRTLQLICNMIQTMKSAKGIGIAAPQVRVSKRILVFWLPAARDDLNSTGVPLTVLINPSVEHLNPTDTVVDWEGCLSVPGKRGKVFRSRRIRYSGYCPEVGCVVERIAEGWHARVVQHEFDHLNGILYPEIMSEEDKLLTLEQYSALNQLS